MTVPTATSQLGRFRWQLVFPFGTPLTFDGKIRPSLKQKMI